MTEQHHVTTPRTAPNIIAALLHACDEQGIDVTITAAATEEHLLHMPQRFSKTRIQGTMPGDSTTHSLWFDVTFTTRYINDDNKEPELVLDKIITYSRDNATGDEEEIIPDNTLAISIFGDGHINTVTRAAAKHLSQITLVAAKKTLFDIAYAALRDAFDTAQREHKYDHTVTITAVTPCGPSPVRALGTAHVIIEGEFSMHGIASAAVPMAITCDADINSDGMVNRIKVFSAVLLDDNRTPIVTSFDEGLSQMQIYGPAVDVLQNVIFLLALKADEYFNTQITHA